MQIKQFLTEDRAVSPVIGVILMVAITVILAAVIGTFVLGLGQNVQSTPQASFSFDFDSDNTSVNVYHDGGSEYNSDNTNQLSVNASGGGSTTFSLPVSAGDNASIISYSPGETVRVVWTSPGGENSATVASQQAPS